MLAHTPPPPHFPGLTSTHTFGDSLDTGTTFGGGVHVRGVCVHGSVGVCVCRLNEGVRGAWVSV